MKYFGIRHKPIKDWRYYRRLLHIPFVILVIGAFTVFTLYHNVTNIVFSKSKVDVFKEDLQQIALYFWMVDRDFSHFLITLDDIVTSYMAGENILTDKTQEIEDTWQYIYENKNYLAGLGFENYNDIMEFLVDSWKYKDEFFMLLGKDSPQNYLVILQNSNEKRPNGGFFGSFAFIQVSQARIEQLQIIDSYFPDFIGRNTGVTPPVRSQTFLPERRVAFVAANWFGFTPTDGANIKKLYEDIFGGQYNQSKVDEVIDPTTFAMLANKHIKGVIFIETKLLETIMPSITQKIWERQFINAAVDIIRGESRSNKKELYIDEVNTFFKDNALTITKHIINNFSTVLDQRGINIFLSNVSDQLHGLVQKRSLTNIYDPDYIYARDINDSYNKIDAFITKTIEIVDANGATVIQSDSDIVPVAALENGNYTLHVTYSLYVPNFYKDIIASLEKKYDIQLSNRERIILGLMPNVGITPEQALRYRTRSMLYFPPYMTIPRGQDIGYRHEFFKPPFAYGLYYNMRIGENDTRTTISVDFTVNK